MIPHGLNPHGLEDRTLTFCVLENGSPVFTCTSQNRLYCWATFPKELTDFLNNNYQVSPNEVELSIQMALDQDSWNALPKYKSKEMSGNHFMIYGNQTFYYQVWIESNLPDFATIYVLDISGSMNNDSDKRKVKCGITGEIYEYNCYAYT